MNKIHNNNNNNNNNNSTSDNPSLSLKLMFFVMSLLITPNLISNTNRWTQQPRGHCPVVSECSLFTDMGSDEVLFTSLGVWSWGEAPCIPCWQCGGIKIGVKEGRMESSIRNERGVVNLISNNIQRCNISYYENWKYKHRQRPHHSLNILLCILE